MNACRYVFNYRIDSASVPLVIVLLNITELCMGSSKRFVKTEYPVVYFPTLGDLILENFTLFKFYASGQSLAMADQFPVAIGPRTRPQTLLTRCLCFF